MFGFTVAQPTQTECTCFDAVALSAGTNMTEYSQVRFQTSMN